MINKLAIPTLYLLVCTLQFVASFSPPKITPQCTFVYSNSFEHCSEDEETNSPSVRRNRVYSPAYVHKKPCRSTGGVCGKVFNITRIYQQSFVEKTLAKISDMLEQCCGKCGKYYLGDIHESLSHIDISSIETSDIIFPVLGQASLTELYGFHFIPMFDVPGAYYFAKEKSEKEMANDMIFGCLNMWSLFVICLLMAIISGFIIWVTETPKNPEEFPRPFHIGLFEGFWWSFISMTTVGYGDRAPKSPAGRIFAVVWILIGITITSIYIASLANEIMAIRAPFSPNLAGKHVGGLKHRLHDAMMVAQHGGILHDFEFNDTVYGVFGLMNMLNKKKIDGFLINKSTYFYFSRMIEDDRNYKHLEKAVHDIHLIKAELEYKGVTLVSGMLVRFHEHYEFFRRYFQNNWLEIQACDAFHLNNEDQKLESGTTNHFEGLFYPFLYWTLAILAVIFVIGIIYEIRRRYVIRKDHINEKAILRLS